MDSPNQPPAEPPSPPPDLLARVRAARVMILAIGGFLALLGAAYLVLAAWHLVAPTAFTRGRVAIEAVAGAFFAVVGGGLLLARPTARRSAYSFATVVGFLQLWIGADLLISLWLNTHGLFGRWPPGSPQTQLLVGVDRVVFGIVLILCGNLLTTALAVLEADLDRFAGIDATIRHALSIAPASLLSQLREEQWRIRFRWRPLGKLALGLVAATAFTTLSTLVMNRDHGPTDTDWAHARAQLAGIARSGDGIVRLLTEYHAHHGKYPPWLGALDHDQLHLLPPQPAEAKDPWEYSLLNGGRDYQISVDLPRDIWPGGFGYKAVLCYRSDGHYDNAAFDGKLAERFGKWALYVD